MLHLRHRQHIRILLIEEEVIVRATLVALVSSWEGFHIVAEAATKVEALIANFELRHGGRSVMESRGRPSLIGASRQNRNTPQREWGCRSKLTTVFGHVLVEVFADFNAPLMGFAGDFTQQSKFTLWEQTSSDVCHKSDTVGI